MPALTDPKHEKFAQACFKGKTQEEAYVAAGFRRHRGNASRLFNDPGVMARLAELQTVVAEKAMLTRLDLLKQLQPLVEADIRQLFKPDGTPIPVHELDKGVAAALQSLEVDVTPGSEDGAKPTVITHKIRHYDRRAAIDTYARIAGHMREAVELSGPNGGPIEIWDWVAMSKQEKRALLRPLAYALRDVAKPELAAPK